MSAARRQEGADDAAASVADRCRDSEFVRLLATPDGEALAATGLLADALASTGTAFHASLTRRPDRVADGADLTVTVGHPADEGGGDDGDDTDSDGDRHSLTRPLATTAYATAEALDAGPDPVLALAGVVASGDSPDSHADLVEAAEVTSEAGLGVPTDDAADGLAHTTLAHVAFSGDREATLAALDGVDRDGRTLASLLALAAVESEDAPPRAAHAVERALGAHPLPDGPFATLEGYADVLDAVARERPGRGCALVLGSPEDHSEAALDVWRDHARAAHAAVRSASVARHDGCVVARVAASTGVLETAARLVRDYRSPEPVVLAVAVDGADGPDASGDREATTEQDASADRPPSADRDTTTAPTTSTDDVASVAVAADRDLSTTVREAATAIGGTAVGRGGLATARVDRTETDAFVGAIRRAL
jgi:hypothetical protein